MFGLSSTLIAAALLIFAPDTGANVMKAARNVTVRLTCIDSVDQLTPPHWFRNGTVVLQDDGYRSSRDEDTGELIGILTISGNRTCGTFNVYCLLHSRQTVHNTTLTVEGLLPFPENIHINEQNDNLLINWDPPYSKINTDSGVIHVDPHITQYTVYIVDNYTGNYLDRVNTTETSISLRRKTTDDHSCPMYGVTAWNAGGEGDMSVLLPGYLLRIPNSIAANQVVIQPGNGALHIHLHVTEPCTVRMPNYLLVTVMSTDRGNITTNVTVQHPVTRIRVALPQNVDECNLIVRVRAQNSAGMSSATEIPVGCQATGTTATPTTRSTGIDTNATDPVDHDQLQQGDNNIIYIATGSGVAAMVMVVTVALLLIILWKCKPRTSKVKPPEENLCIQSPSPGGPPVDQPDSPPAYSPPVDSPPVDSPLAVVYTTSEAYSRTPSTESSGSDQPLLPSPKPTGLKSGIKVVQGMSGERVTTGVGGVQIATGVGGVAVSLQSSTTAYTRSGAQSPDGNPHLMYAQIDPTKYRQTQPPANDSQVQYAQIEYQDQL